VTKRATLQTDSSFAALELLGALASTMTDITTPLPVRRARSCSRRRTSQGSWIRRGRSCRSSGEEVSALDLGPVGLVAGLTGTDEHWPSICELISPQGRVGLIDDSKAIDATALKRKSASLHWELMFTRSLFGTADMIEQHRLLTEVARLVDERMIRTTMTQNLGPLTVENLKRAHALVESGRSRGKVVLDGI